MFGAKRTARLGTEKNPEFGSVQSKARFKEVKSTFEEHGWKYRIGLEPDKLEVNDIIRLLNPPKPTIARRKSDVMNPVHVEAGESLKTAMVVKAV